MKFRIEYIARDAQPVYVLARQIESGDFILSSEPTLGGVAIRQQVSSPRSLNTSGKPDLGVFAFTLVSATDKSKLCVEQVVELAA